MSWKHQSLRSLEAVALALYQDTLQVLKMAYNLKMFVGSRKIIQRTFQIKGLASNYQVKAKPFLLSALHLSPNNQIKPSKRRFAANLSKSVWNVRHSDSRTKSNSNPAKHRAAKISVFDLRVLPKFW
jgi:hypothetical protein